MLGLRGRLLGGGVVKAAKTALLPYLNPPVETLSHCRYRHPKYLIY